MKKIILSISICTFVSVFNIVHLVNFDDSKLELLFKQVEALAADEMLPPVDVICDKHGYGRCYETMGSPRYWWCKFSGYQSHYCVRPFDYME